MKPALRVLSILIGLMAFISACRFVVTPEAMVARLGMPLLDGIGASTQLGDIGAFFLAVAILIGLGQRHGQSHMLLGAALLPGSAALLRTLVFLFGHADFAAAMIGPEVIMTIILVAASRVRADELAEDGEAALAD